MTADHPAAGGTSPLRLFPFQKRIHAVVTNGIEVIDHAHVILCPVTLVQGFQTFAWIRRALDAKPHPAFTD